MRTSYFYSVVFALLTSANIGATAAPATKPEISNSPLVTEVSSKAQTEKVDINKADTPTLRREFSGVGEAKAKAIVAYLENNGPFASVGELLEVKGIGKVLLEKNREKLEEN